MGGDREGNKVTIVQARNDSGSIGGGEKWLGCVLKVGLTKFGSCPRINGI